MSETYKSENYTITADDGFYVENGYSIGKPIFQGIYVPIDRVYMTKESGEKVTAEEWLSGVIKEF